ncbi:hypothetical protein LCGC14_0464360, partial [marine sediment metagenome]
ITFGSSLIVKPFIVCCRYYYKLLQLYVKGYNMKDDKINIQIDKDLHQFISDKKLVDRESYNDTLKRILKVR